MLILYAIEATNIRKLKYGRCIFDCLTACILSHWASLIFNDSYSESGEKARNYSRLKQFQVTVKEHIYIC